MDWITSREPTPFEISAAFACSLAYRASFYRVYINASDLLCVVCDDGLPTKTGFMRIDDVWIEFEPEES